MILAPEDVRKKLTYMAGYPVASCCRFLEEHGLHENNPHYRPWDPKEHPIKEKPDWVVGFAHYYAFDGKEQFNWPENYLEHYIEGHCVQPSPYFYTWVMNFNF